MFCFPILRLLTSSSLKVETNLDKLKKGLQGPMGIAYYNGLGQSVSQWVRERVTLKKMQLI